MQLSAREIDGVDYQEISNGNPSLGTSKNSGKDTAIFDFAKVYTKRNDSMKDLKYQVMSPDKKKRKSFKKSKNKSDDES